MSIVITGVKQKWFRRFWIISLLEKMKVEIRYRGNKVDLVWEIYN